MLIPNPEYIQSLIELVNIAPYPHHMSMRLAEIEFDRATIELETGPQHLQSYGIVHGGVLATLIDTATFWAVFMRVPEEDGVVNVDLKLNYLKPVTNELLRTEGRAIRSGKAISYAEAKVLDPEGQIVAHGTSTLMTLPGKGLTGKVPKFITVEGSGSRDRNAK